MARNKHTIEQDFMEAEEDEQYIQDMADGYGYDRPEEEYAYDGAEDGYAYRDPAGYAEPDESPLPDGADMSDAYDEYGNPYEDFERDKDGNIILTDEEKKQLEEIEQAINLMDTEGHGLMPDPDGHDEGMTAPEGGADGPRADSEAQEAGQTRATRSASADPGAQQQAAPGGTAQQEAQPGQQEEEPQAGDEEEEPEKPADQQERSAATLPERLTRRTWPTWRWMRRGKGGTRPTRWMWMATSWSWSSRSATRPSRRRRISYRIPSIRSKPPSPAIRPRAWRSTWTGSRFHVKSL